MADSEWGLSSAFASGYYDIALMRRLALADGDPLHFFGDKPLIPWQGFYE